MCPFLHVLDFRGLFITTDVQLIINFFLVLQIRARLLIEFACAGKQNVLLVGPHGCGKTTMVQDFLHAQGNIDSYFSKSHLHYTLQ